MLDHLLSLLAPHPCASCGEIGALLCDKCKYDIISTIKQLCLLCRALSDEGICTKHGTFFTKSWIIGDRQGPLQHLVGGFKFQSLHAASDTLARLLHERLPILPVNTVIIPIPTVQSHVRERGYDHTLRLAKSFGRLRGLTTHSLLARLTQTTQHTVGREERFHQAKQAYRAIRELDSSVPYLLIDDIVTTGATVQEAAHQLHRAGARIIWVAAIARQPLD